ncbi:MAG: DUF819 family protein [Pseudomonadota bacterium]
MATVFSQSDVFALLLILFGSALLGLVWDKSRFATWCSGVIVVIAIPAILASLKIIPREATVYETMGDIFVPLLVAMLLFDANLIRILREAGTLLIAFFVAVVGTTVGAITALSLLDVGPDTSNIAGVFTATYIGGVPNFIGVAEATGIADSGVLPVLIAVDNAVGVLFFLFVGFMLASKAVQRLLGYASADRVAPRSNGESEYNDMPPPFVPIKVLLAFSVALALTWVSKAFANAIGQGDLYLLFLTFITVVLATAFSGFFGQLKGAFESGYILCYIYFATFAPEVDFVSAVRDGPSLFVMASLIIAIHVVIVFGLGRLLKLRLSELMVASVAAIWGVGASVALAASQRWTVLITPAILVASLGVAIGTFIGLLVSKIF